MTPTNQKDECEKCGKEIFSNWSRGPDDPLICQCRHPSPQKITPSKSEVEDAGIQRTLTLDTLFPGWSTHFPGLWEYLRQHDSSLRQKTLMEVRERVEGLSAVGNKAIQLNATNCEAAFYMGCNAACMAIDELMKKGV